MSGQRVLGIIGFDAAGGLVARRALDSGSTLVIHGLSCRDERDLSSLRAERGGDASGSAPVAAGRSGPSILLVSSLSDLVAALPRPRALLLDLGALRPSRREAGAGRAASPEAIVAETLGLLEEGDLLMTCAGADCAQATSFAERCAKGGFRFVDLGVSGGKGRFAGVVVAAGGSEADCAFAQGFFGSGPVQARLGEIGAGNASAVVRSALGGLQIELLSEAYHILKSGIRASHDEMRTVFAQWNAGELADPLLVATADALGLRDEDGEPLIEKVLDAAPAFGACSEAASFALASGAPAMMLAQAAASSALAARKDERVDASAVLGGPKPAQTGERQAMVEELRRALLAATILAIGESFALLRHGSETRGLGIDLARAAKLWAASGESRMLSRAAAALERTGGRGSLLLDASFKPDLDQSLPSLRRVTVRALEGGIPVPAFSSALGFYDSYRSTWLPANLSNALKDSLLGLGFERVDRPRGELFHSDWR